MDDVLFNYYHSLLQLSTDTIIQMVKVWYEPPPYGPGTSLNRPSYGQQAGGAQLIQQLSRRPQGTLIAGAIVAFSAIAYIPISKFHDSII